MKRTTFLMLIAVLFGFVACEQNTTDENTDTETQENQTIDLASYTSYGEEFDLSDGVKSNDEARAEFAKLNEGDSVKLQFKAPINEVCKMKGCWMVLDLGNQESTRVSFKDYGFFVPKDAAGAEVIVNGWAKNESTSVEDLRHIAEDAGKSEEEIMAITEPEVSYKFVADGVWMNEYQPVEEDTEEHSS